MNRWMPVIWLTVLAVAMAIGRAHAAPPPCYPQTSDDVTIFATPEGQCAQWFCDAGHKWMPISICGTDTEAVLAAPALRAAMLLSKEAKDALWAATFTRPVTPGSPDDLMLKAAAARPVPTTTPPSGLVTQTVFAYKLNASTDKAAMSIVGTVPLGTPCDATQNINGLYRIDRAKVKFPAGTLMPLITLGDCKPK